MSLILLAAVFIAVAAALIRLVLWVDDWATRRLNRDLDAGLRYLHRRDQEWPQ